jgi:hypothetical protein
VSETIGPSTETDRAFGSDNRARLLAHYFESVAREPVSAESAWRHTYRLLLWIDRTIGLAHCYESDKCQPGRPWYARSLNFHRWVAGELATSPAELANEIDWLFRTATRDLAATAGQRAIARLRKAEEQRAPFEGEGMPRPGDDPELEALITETLVGALGSEPPLDLAHSLSERIQAYMSTENKRKNLVGEGFEDTVAELLRRVPAIGGTHDVRVRPSLHDLPGFNPPRGGDKTRKVDLALVRATDGWRVLVSCKWSVRSDREEQFATDFETYARLEARGQDFDYVLITNEFDPARLAAACEARRPNGALFSQVVHVNPDGPHEVYRSASGSASGRTSGGIERALAHYETGRLSSMRSWLTSLAEGVSG